MYIGIVIWLIFCGFVCCGDRKHIVSNKSFYNMFFPFLAIVMGLRADTVGVDTKSYKAAFELVSSHSVNEIINNDLNLAIETLYLLFMKAVSWIADDYFVFQFVFAVIYISGMMHFIRRNTDDPVLATSLFLGLDLYLTVFNIQRQMLAVMISLLAWESMKNKKWKYTIALWVVASSIHRTAIIFSLVSLLYFFRNNKTIIRVATLLIIAISLRFDMVLKWLTLNAPEYRNYYGNHKTIHSAGGVWGVWVLIIILSLILILRKDKVEDDEEKNKDDRVVAVFSLVYIITNIVGLYFNYAERIGLYFLPFVILLFINFEKVLNESYRLKYRYGVMFCFLAYFILTSRSSQYDYNFCF